MINRYNIVKNIIAMLKDCDSEFDLFGSRYIGDRRYVVQCLSGCGNCAHDYYSCCVGNNVFNLTVTRRYDSYNQSYYPYSFHVSNAFDEITLYVCDAI